MKYDSSANAYIKMLTEARSPSPLHSGELEKATPEFHSLYDSAMAASKKAHAIDPRYRKEIAATEKNVLASADAHRKAADLHDALHKLGTALGMGSYINSENPQGFEHHHSAVAVRSLLPN